MRVPQGEERKEQSLCEDIVVENFPHLGDETDIQAYEVHRSPHRCNTKRISLRLCIKTVKTQRQRILKGAGEKWLILHKRSPIKWLGDFPKETLQTRREWDDIFKALKGKKKKKTNCQQRNYLTKKSCLLKLEERWKFSKTKAERVHHH